MTTQEKHLCLALQGILTRVEAIQSTGRMLQMLDETDVFACPDWVQNYATPRNRAGLAFGVYHQAEGIHDLVEEIEKAFGIQMYAVDSPQPIDPDAGRNHASQ